jgi:hypothetical protein
MRLRRPAVVLVLLAIVGVVVGLVLSAASPSKPRDAAGFKASGATTVQRQNLVETDTESGTLSYADPQTVYNRLSGTITWLPSAGQVIRPGGTLFKVDGHPVILMNGSTPAYRDLGPGDSAGEDILQLNRNLVHLGFNPDGIVLDDEWQTATTAGVDQLQASLGEPETGTMVLGQVVFLSGDQLISTVEAGLGGDAGSAGTGTPSGVNASAPDPTVAPEYVSLETRVLHGAKRTTPKPHGHPERKRTHTLQALIALLKAEIAELRSRPDNPGASSPNTGSRPKSSSGNTPASSGSPSTSDGSSPTPILQTTSVRLVVTVDLDPSKQSEAKLGRPVTVQLPDGATVNGKITAVSRVAQTANGNTGNTGNSGSGDQGGGENGSGSSGSTVPVTIMLSGRHAGAGLDQAVVSVNFTEAVANNVLTVAVTALLATGGGNYAVQAAAAPHKLIPVTTGLFSAGNVQISGQGIYPGLQVTDSQG